MRKIREVLRLKAAGLKIREIAESTGTARTTVYEYLVRAEGTGPVLAVASRHGRRGPGGPLFPPATAELARRRPVPDWREVHRELRSRKHVTLRLLWLEWKAEPPRRLGLQPVLRPLRALAQWPGRRHAAQLPSRGEDVRRLQRRQGTGHRPRSRGEVAQAEVFVAVLGCSGMLYVEATRDQGLGSWVMAHVHAWEAYGGVTVATTPDNLRSGVTKACYYDPEINASYAELARHYSTVILPTRTYRPRDKAAVEAGVLVVERWVLAPLRKLQFFSLAEVNKAIRPESGRAQRAGVQRRADFAPGTVRGTGTPSAKAVARPALRTGRVEKSHRQHRLPRRAPRHFQPSLLLGPLHARAPKARAAGHQPRRSRSTRAAAGWRATPASTAGGVT